jgi:serine/threonine-protein kinase
MPINPNQLVVGQKLPGVDWVLRGYLGQGGMGIVLDVIKPVGGGTPVDEGLPGAIKIIRPELAWRPEYLEGLFAEVRLLLKIDHPNIVRVLDFGTFPDGTPYVVMERLVGGTLRQLLDRFGPLPPEVAYQIIFQASEALDHAHNEGVIHRDFKLDNVFVHNPSKMGGSKAAKPQIKVLDFGIAAFRPHGSRLVGTPKYMAPEQLRGEPITVQTDVYATALVLYELLTGRLPWNVPSANIVQARLHVDPIPPSHYKPYIPKDMEHVILAGLARDPADRPQSCFELADKLFALQHCQQEAGPEVGETAPDLLTLTDVVRRASANPGPASSVDTQPGMVPPPLEGRSLESAPPELLEDQSLAVRRRFAVRLASTPSDSLSAAQTSVEVIAPMIPGDGSFYTPTHHASHTLPIAVPQSVIVDLSRGAPPPVLVQRPVQARPDPGDAGSMSGTSRSHGPELGLQNDATRIASRTMLRARVFVAASAIVAIAFGVALFAAWAHGAKPWMLHRSPEARSGAPPVATNGAPASAPVPPGPVSPIALRGKSAGVVATGSPRPAASTSNDAGMAAEHP